MFKYTKIGLIVIFLITAFVVSSNATLAQRLNLPPELVDAVRKFLGADPILRACDYKDGMLILVKPVATGVGEGRYEAGDIVEIRDPGIICSTYGDVDPLGKEEKTKLLPLYYPAKLTREQIQELTAPEMNQEPGTMNYGTDQNPVEERMMKRRKTGLDYTKFLNQNEILKVRNFEKLDRLPEIDLSTVQKKETEELSVVPDSEIVRSRRISLGLKNWKSKIKNLLNPIAFAASGTKTVCPTGQGCDYISVNAWEAAEQADLTGTGPAIAQIQGDWSAGPDTATAYISGWVTTESDYVKVYTMPEARHSGVYDPTKYVLRLDTSYRSAMYVAADHPYVKIEGLQIKNNAGANGAFGIDSRGGYADISRNIVLGFSGTNDAGMQVGYYSTGDKVYNNIVYDNYTGIEVDYSTSAYIYNNTVHGNTYGIRATYGSGSDGVLVNNLAAGNTVDYSAAGTGAFISVTNCASADATADDWGGLDNRTGQTFDFASEVGDDFRLLVSDGGAKDFGTSTPSSVFTTDIEGETRSEPWDIGADEYGGQPEPPPADGSTEGDKVLKGGATFGPGVIFRK